MEFPFWLAALFIVYAGGCLFFAGRFLYSLCQIVRLIRSGERAVLEDGTRLVVTDRTIPPFSWMKYIVISRIDMEESGAEILAHEQAHIRACHSLDMWLAGCISNGCGDIIFWFAHCISSYKVKKRPLIILRRRVIPVLPLLFVSGLARGNLGRYVVIPLRCNRRACRCLKLLALSSASRKPSSTCSLHIPLSL